MKNLQYVSTALLLRDDGYKALNCQDDSNPHLMEEAIGMRACDGVMCVRWMGEAGSYVLNTM